MRQARRRRQKLPEEAISIEIQRLSHDGRGVASIDGKIAFVEGAISGERVMAQYTGRRRQYDELKTIEVLSASPDRVEPPCAHAQICGGCAMQHINSSAQITLKEKVLHDQLQHIGGLTDFTPIAPMLSQTEGYRRKARLGLRYVSKKESMLIGFREKNSAFIAEMSSCAVLNEAVSRLIMPLRELLGDFDGRMQIPQIEVAIGEHEQAQEGGDHNADQLAFVVRHLEPLSDSDLQALIAFAQQHGIQLYLQAKGPDTIHKVWPVEGEERLYYYLPEFDLKMAFHPSDFTQVNGELNRNMIAFAMSLLDPQEDETVLDLFCGLGNFTLPIATRCKKVVGVEGSEEMVQRGYENAKANGINNADFYSANLIIDFDKSTWAQPVYDKILLDPPRSGALEIIPRIAAFLAKKIVYISCNPATLARDAGELTKLGYVMTQAGVMDMFPHTSHVESIAEFVLKKQ